MYDSIICGMIGVRYLLSTFFYEIVDNINIWMPTVRGVSQSTSWPASRPVGQLVFMPHNVTFLSLIAELVQACGQEEVRARESAQHMHTTAHHHCARHGREIRSVRVSGRLSTLFQPSCFTAVTFYDLSFIYPTSLFFFVK